MKDSYFDICKLLAASGFRDRDIAEFSRTIFKRGQKAFTDDVLSMKHMLSELQNLTPYDTPSPVRQEAQGEIAQRIERLIILETGLPKLDAIALLTEELHKRFPDLPVPPESRKGFRSWIHRLASVYPEKELLHLATSIRNRYVHERPSDWRLK
jgi:hypothetical protein